MNLILGIYEVLFCLEIAMGSYQCGSHSIYISDPRSGEVFIIALLCGRVCDPGACQRCVVKRCKKIAKGISAERENGSGELQWMLIDEGDVKSASRNCSWYNVRHCKLPLETGVIFIVEDNHRLWFPSGALPEDKDELEEWIKMACRTPRGRRMSGSRAKRDKDSKIMREAWGYPKPKTKPVEGRTSYKVALRSAMLKDYLETAGATIDSWHGQMNEFGFTKYKATPEIQEAVLEALEMNDLVIHCDEGPIFNQERNNEI